MDIVLIPAFKYFIEIVFLRQIKWEAASKFNGSLVTNGLGISDQLNYLVCNWETSFLKKSNINRNKTSPLRYFLNDTVPLGYQRSLGPSESVLLDLNMQFCREIKTCPRILGPSLITSSEGVMLQDIEKLLCLLPLPQHLDSGSRERIWGQYQLLDPWDTGI